MLKKILKKNNNILSLSSFIYNLLSLKFSFACRRNIFQVKGSFLKKCKFKITGNKNIISIGKMGRLRNCTICIIGNNNSLKIGGGHTIIANTTIWLQGNNCTIQIGEDFTMEGGAISVTENGKIHIGNDCMFSFGIDIRNGDSHSIFDLNGNRINKAKDIIIGDHVWLGAGVSILKGVKISSNSIIGTKSLVTKNLESPYSIYAGNPAQIIREGAKWCRILKD